MSRASDIANDIAEDFTRATRMFSDPLYVEALEELICMLEASLEAKKEEMREDEENGM